MTYSDELIVLNSTKVGERSLVLHCLSREWGRRSFILSAPRASGALAMYLPLSILDAEIVDNARSDLWRLQRASTAFLLHGIRSSVGKNAIAMFISELLYRSIRDGECSDEIFEWCRSSILLLDALKDNYANFHLLFLLEFAAVLGFRPSIDDLAPFAGEHYSLLCKLLSVNSTEFLLIPLAGSVRSLLAGILVNYLSYHLDCQLNIRSLDVLGELF